MKQAGIFRRLLWLGGLLVFLSGCASSSTQGVHGVPSPPVQSVQASPTLTAQAYRLPPVKGVFAQEGLYTKTLWAVDNPQAARAFLIDGTDLADPNQTYHDTGNAMSGPGLPTGTHMHTYTSYLQAPTLAAGACWSPPAMPVLRLPCGLLAQERGRGFCQN